MPKHPNTPSKPIELFSQWFLEASAHQKIQDATAVNLATASADGTPSNRMVLLKSYDEQNGFAFYTNAHSLKGQQMAENPKAALCFYWAPIDKQIRIEGTVHTLNAAQADAYFETRPTQAKIGAWLSKQSQPMTKQTIAELTAQIASITNPTPFLKRPAHWLGYCVCPKKIEFWQNGSNRLHQRVQYTKQQNTWLITHLYP